MYIHAVKSLGILGRYQKYNFANICTLLQIMLEDLVIHRYRKKVDSTSLLEHSFGLSTPTAGTQADAEK